MAAATRSEFLGSYLLEFVGAASIFERRFGGCASYYRTRTWLVKLTWVSHASSQPAPMFAVRCSGAHDCNPACLCPRQKRHSIFFGNNHKISPNSSKTCLEECSSRAACAAWG